MPTIIHLPEVRSTNTYLLDLLRNSEQPNLYTVCTYCQTAGRGQAGNAWESEPYQNLTFTTLFDMQGRAADEQFALSMLVPLAIVEVLREQCHIEASIKWPNDIYVGDEKICGILIEGVISGGEIRQAIAGVGLNVNQTHFLSDAPNPTSASILTGRTFNLDVLMQAVVDTFERLLPLLNDVAQLRTRYMASLYRRDGLFWWREIPVGVAPMMISRTLDNDCFEARIADVDKDGCLVLERPNGDRKAYHFKQIRYIFA